LLLISEIAPLDGMVEKLAAAAATVVSRLS